MQKSGFPGGVAVTMIAVAAASAQPVTDDPGLPGPLAFGGETHGLAW